MGEAVAMVVADDRYVAEDAAEPDPRRLRAAAAVVGSTAARAAEHLVHDDVPGNVGARAWCRRSATPPPRSPRRRTGSSSTSTVERSACTPLEGRGVVARWDPDVSRLRVWSSTQTSTGVRAAVAAKLGPATSARST